MIPLSEAPGVVELTETEGRRVAAKAKGGGQGELFLHGGRLLDPKMEGVLERDVGDGSKYYECISYH